MKNILFSLDHLLSSTLLNKVVIPIKNALTTWLLWLSQHCINYNEATYFFLKCKPIA